MHSAITWNFKKKKYYHFHEDLLQNPKYEAFVQLYNFQCLFLLNIFFLRCQDQFSIFSFFFLLFSHWSKYPDGNSGQQYLAVFLHLHSFFPVLTCNELIGN